MVMKFHNCDIFVYNLFLHFVTCRLHPPAAWKALSTTPIANLPRNNDEQSPMNQPFATSTSNFPRKTHEPLEIYDIVTYIYLEFFVRST